MIRWQIILEELGPNIQHISGVGNISADTLSRLPSTSVNKYEPTTSKSQCCADKLFTSSGAENNEYCFLLNILIVKREQQKYLIKLNDKLRAYISYQGSGHSKQDIDEVKIICYDRKNYVLQTLCRHVLDWYHFYLKHPGGSRLANFFDNYAIGKAL